MSLNPSRKLLATTLHKSLFHFNRRGQSFVVSIDPSKVYFGQHKRVYSSASVAQQHETESTSTTASSTITPLYTFHGISERDMLMSELRHHKVSWTNVADYFQITPMDAFYTYIDVASKATYHGWSPRMTTKDIEHYLGQSR